MPQPDHDRPAPPLTDWIGREEVQEDILSPRPALELRSILPGTDPLTDGAALPPVPLPRRMWAGGRFQFPGDLRLGERVTKTSRILDVVEKSGQSGALCFVTVEHRFAVAGEVRLIEEHDIVYREDPASGAPAPAPPQADVAQIEEQVTPSAVMLFRYSAATFNGHRIHYDIDYCRDVEGYPGLVFHGPLTATLLADLARRAGHRDLARYAFRAVSPLFDTAPFTLRARVGTRGAEVWAANPDGALAMRAEAVYR